MRFPQVNIGQRFIYKGKSFCKTGPLTASEEGSGVQRMIPKATEVTLLDAAGKPMKEIKQHYNRTEVVALCRRLKSDLIEQLVAMADEEGRLPLDQVSRLIEQQPLPE